MPDRIERVDAVVIGAGMAGASVAYELSKHLRVVLFEREARPGVHSTGRSAALFSETYGNAAVRALTRASRAVFDRPPEGFASHPLLSPRGVLLIAKADQLDRARAAAEEGRRLVPSVDWVDGERCRALVPILRDIVAGGVVEPDAMDIDVDTLHQGYLRAAKARGAALVTAAAIERIEQGPGGWTVATPHGAWSAPVLVNAAGAWADTVAALAGIRPVGLVPRRRTAAMVAAPPDVEIRHWPMVIDADEQFYFKPDAGQLLVSPADETPVPPHDVQPGDLDIAIAIDRIQAVAVLPVQRIRHAWAGLRSFVADRTPVIGADPETPSFIWLAGQGGYGIQTAPAAASLAAALILNQPLPELLTRHGVEPADFAPARLRTGSAVPSIGNTQASPPSA